VRNLLSARLQCCDLGKGIATDFVGEHFEQLSVSAFAWKARELCHSLSSVDVVSKLALMTGLSTIQRAYVALTGGTMAVYNPSGMAYYGHAD
jgi:hypothetical protein